MTKNYYLYLQLFLCIVCLPACVHDRDELGTRSEPQKKLTVEEARAFFESTVSGSSTRADTQSLTGLFALGEIIPDWTGAENSENERISCVDIPASVDNVFRVARKDAHGKFSQVPAYGKLLVVRKQRTEQMAVYMHFFIPEALYDTFYDGDLSELFVNCHPRDDFSGVELYTQMDGTIAAAARYVEGELIDRVFMGDETYSDDQKAQLLRRIVRNMYFQRRNGGAVTRTADGEWWDFGGRACFRDSNGTLYFVVRLNDGSFAATMDFDGTMGNCDGKGKTGGGSDGNGSDGGLDPNPGSGPNLPKPNPNPGPGPGSGGPGGDLINPGEPTFPDKPDSLPPAKFRPPKLEIDPIPGILIIPKPDPDPKPDPGADDPEEEKKVPCADSLAGEGNPLREMKISDDNRSWKSNTWGFVRIGADNKPRFHDGLDLAGERGKTVVYAMYTGRVTQVIYEQPNRIGPNQYPADYQGGDRNSAGNRITIESKLPDGTAIQVSYWHLDVMEHNEYTQTFGIRDSIHRGQPIGVVGNSGNAWNSKTHLHLKTYVKITDNKTDPKNNPFLYLYTRFSEEDGAVIRDC